MRVLHGTTARVVDRDGGSRPIDEQFLACLVLLAQHYVLFAAPALVQLAETGVAIAIRVGLLRQEGQRPYWYIRYRRKVLVGKDQIERKEVWHTLGSCDAITKRKALRMRDEVMREVNREVYTIQSQILFQDFAEIYMKQHTVTLAPGGQKRDLSLIRNHLLPSFGPVRLCDIGTEEVQAFLNAKNRDGLSWW